MSNQNSLDFVQKQPLGLRPEYILLEQRQIEIEDAVARYVEAAYSIPSEWFDEHARNCRRLKEIL